MDALLAIKNRRSIREYLSKPVEFDKITAVIEAGTYAPSAGNSQIWKFIIVTDQGLRNDLAEKCLEQFWMAKAPVYIAMVANQEKSIQNYGKRGKRLYAVQSAAAAIQNMLLAAHALGLGACWVGAFDETLVSESLGIPDGFRPQAIITLGYSSEVPEDKELTGLESAVYFNGFGNRIKHVHRVLKDYRVSVQNVIDKANPMKGENKFDFKSRLDKIKSKLQRK